LKPIWILFTVDNLELTQFALADKTYGDVSNQPKEEYEVQTRTLYGMAKEFIGTVKQIAKAQ